MRKFLFLSFFALCLCSCADNSPKTSVDNPLELTFYNLNEGLESIYLDSESYVTEDRIKINKSNEDVNETIQKILANSEFFYIEGRDGGSLARVLDYEYTDSNKYFTMEDLGEIDVNELVEDFEPVSKYYALLFTNLFESNDSYLNENKLRLDIYLNFASESDYREFENLLANK